MAKQLVTRFATMYHPAPASRRLLSITGVRDCDRGFGFHGSCDVRGLTTRCSYAMATGRFFNISGVRNCDRGYGFNGCHDVRGFTSEYYRGARDKSLYEEFMNQGSITRYLFRLFKVATLENTHVVFRIPSEEEYDDCLNVRICICEEGADHVSISFDRNTVWVKAFRGRETFVFWYELPDIDSTEKIYKTSDIKAEAFLEFGLIKLIIPKLKKKEMVFDIDVKDYFGR